ncbi:MAG: phosphatase PAP2 family protein [Bacteroidales bacterium]|nr:phosphatase PAP2 family protein [Candidatus Cacconaster merdequi]
MKQRYATIAACLLLLLVQACSVSRQVAPENGLQNIGEISVTCPDAARYLPGYPSFDDHETFFNDSLMYRRGIAVRESERGRQALVDVASSLNFYLERFGAAMGVELSREATPATARYLETAYLFARNGIANAKKVFHRQRPYSYFGESSASIEEERNLGTFTSYPSGHSVRAWMVALALSSIDEQHQYDILRTGYELGQSRVIAGFHYQSDVDAARLAAGVAFARLASDGEFFKLMNLAREELANARNIPSREDDGYILEKEVVFSRHNIRSPLSAPGSDLSRVTPYQWVDWGVATAYLTERGGRIERKMGGWFHDTLPLADTLDANNSLIYSNSKQRTIKTAENFISGFSKNLPLRHIYHNDSMDPLFNPAYPVMNDGLRKKIFADMNAFGGVEGTEDEPFSGILAAVGSISDEIRFMEEVIGFKDSPYAKEKGLEHLPLDEMSIILKAGEEPAMDGGYKLVNRIADALVLQYYETGKVFGKEIPLEDVRRIGKVKTVYDEVLFANRTTAVIVSNPLVRYIREELCRADRKFTFLCGHDSNIASISAALGLKLPETVNAVEFTSPIGSKIVLRKFRKGDSEFIDVELVYAAVSQLRENQAINPENPPMVLPVDITGLTRNEDGYYRFEDVLGRFDEVMTEYGNLM